MERWRPRTEQDILSAIKNRTLEENHYLEVKRQLNWSDGAKKEFARDLAQFALDGGHIIVGVTEDKPNKTWLLTPIPDPDVKDIRERIEQVAGGKIDPPLPVTVALIPAGQSGVDSELSDAPASGHYLVIEVPPSDVAPHMVEGRYYSRGDTMKSTLSDAEVLRLHSSRRDQDQPIKDMLRAEVERDPVALPYERGHIYLVAHPALGTDEMAVDFVRGDRVVIAEAIRTADRAAPAGTRENAPALSAAQSFASRDGGIALHSYSVKEGRVVPEPGDEKSTVDVELGEDASVRIFVGRATDHWSGDTGVVLDDLVVATRCDW